MKFENPLRKNQPEAVKRAIKGGDKELQRRLGTAGANTTNARREEMKEFDQHLKEKRAEEDDIMRIDANEHILPINPDDGDHDN